MNRGLLMKPPQRLRRTGPRYHHSLSLLAHGSDEGEVERAGTDVPQLQNPAKTRARSGQAGRKKRGEPSPSSLNGVGGGAAAGSAISPAGAAKRGISPGMLSYIRKKFKSEAAAAKDAKTATASTTAASSFITSRGEGPTNRSPSSGFVERSVVEDPESLAHIDVDELCGVLKALEDKDQKWREELKEQRTLLRQAIKKLNATSIMAGGAAVAMPAESEEEEEAKGDPSGLTGLPVTSKTCEIVHPGAECCTRVMVSVCPSENRATVTVEASVHPHAHSRGSGGDPHQEEEDLGTQDMVALASLAVQRAGGRLFAHETHTLRKKKRAQDRHTGHLELSKILQRGEIVSSRRSDHTSEFGHESFLVEIEDRGSDSSHSGRRIKALFKPRSEEGEESGWHRVGCEAVAYQLNLLLGMDYVPPSHVRKGEIVVDGQEFDEGCFTYFVEGARQLNEVVGEQRRQRHGHGMGGDGDSDLDMAVFLSDTRILDVLIHNSDRHSGHFLYGKHWISDCASAFLIDHAAGFRREACVRMDHENAFMTGPTRIISARTYVHFLLSPQQHSHYLARFATFALRSEKTRRLSRDATK